jgi:hypothetical protein
MTRTILRHVRANVIAYVALFIALGGTSYAAIKLPANSVTDRQIKTGAVRSSEVRNGSLTAKDFRKGVLAAAQPAAAGPRGADGAQGPKGDTGAKGDPGAPGATGPRGPSDAFTLAKSGFGGGAPKLTLPAGRYMLFAKVAITGRTDANDIDNNCTFGSPEDPTHGDFGYAALPQGTPMSVPETTMTLLASADLPSGGTAEVQCNLGTGGAVGRWHLAAIKVETLSRTLG